MVRAALIAALALWAVPAQACRLALVLALDVSSSVDAGEDALQRAGLAAALTSPEVQAAFFASPDPVAVFIFEWSGQSHQTDLTGWETITTPGDLRRVATTLTSTQRSARGLPTALGQALAYATLKFHTGPDCLFQTIDMAGDGKNNQGFGPAGVYATFDVTGVIVNGLVVAGAENNVIDYYTNTVIRGPNAFVEVAQGYADFENAMRRKLIRELSAQIIGRVPIDEGGRG